MAKAAKKAVKANSISENAMDYQEHEKTYELFLWLSKWTVAGCIALLLAMMVGFFFGGGIVGGTIVFFALAAVAFFFI